MPTLFIVREDPAGRFFVRSMVVWMNNLVVVTLIFGNLMYSVHFPSKQDENASSEKFARHEDTSWGVTEIQYCPKPPSPVDPEKVLSDTAEDQIDNTAKSSFNKPFRPGLSSLSLQSDLFSQGSSFKCVSFNDNISISEIPSSAYEEEHLNHLIANDRFAATKCEKAPLKPARSSTGNGIYGQSMDSSPSLPKRQAATTSEVEDLQKNSTESTVPRLLGKSILRRSSMDRSAPCLPPVRIISSVSELEEVPTDKGM